MKVFITGGTSGLGLAFTKHYCALNATVGISSIESEDKIKEIIPSNVKYYQADVTDAQKMHDAIYHFAKENGGLDLVIANAGINLTKRKIPDFQLGKKVIEINVIGVINTVAPSIEIMKNQKSGHIVGIGSLSGLYGLPGMAMYGCSKAAVISMFESFAIDLPNFGIDVTCVAPGFVATPLIKDNNHKMPFLMKTEDAVKKIIWAIENKKSLYLFPRPLNFVAVVLKIMPRALYRFIMKKDLLGLAKE